MMTKKIMFKKLEHGKQFFYTHKGVRENYLKLLLEYSVRYEDDCYPVNVVVLTNGQLFCFKENDIVEIEDEENVQEGEIIEEIKQH